MAHKKQNMNYLPLIGWLFSFLGNVSLALPFWIVWTICGTGEKYFYFLPEVYRSIDFWPCVGLFMAINILKPLLTPNFVSVSQSNTNN
jgi:hypothetical protein